MRPLPPLCSARHGGISNRALPFLRQPSYRMTLRRHLGQWRWRVFTGEIQAPPGSPDGRKPPRPPPRAGCEA